MAENEISGSDAKALVQAGAFAVAEGANMPCTPEAIAEFHSRGVLFAPGKASNGTCGLKVLLARPRATGSGMHLNTSHLVAVSW